MVDEDSQSLQWVHPAQIRFMYIYGMEQLHMTEGQIDEACKARFKVYPCDLTAVQAYRFIEQLQDPTHGVLRGGSDPADP